MKGIENAFFLQVLGGSIVGIREKVLMFEIISVDFADLGKMAIQTVCSSRVFLL
jgi:hypothetical protein